MTIKIKVKVKVKITSNGNGSGQGCPLYTSWEARGAPAVWGRGLSRKNVTFLRFGAIVRVVSDTGRGTLALRMPGSLEMRFTTLL